MGVTSLSLSIYIIAEIWGIFKFSVRKISEKLGGEPLTVHALRRHNHEELSATLFPSLILHIYYSTILKKLQNLTRFKFAAPADMPNLLLYHKFVAFSNFDRRPQPSWYAAAAATYNKIWQLPHLAAATKFDILKTWQGRAILHKKIRLSKFDSRDLRGALCYVNLKV